METSSPLAAMQPSLLPTWGDTSIFNKYGIGQINQINSYGPDSFNFRDISMTGPTKPDYFNINPVRGSSPTASLAADLSQNFHIDASPQLPTPRRSLFTSSLFATMNARENVTTPPLPSSSPGPLNERMDISPLPHKAPFQFAQIEVHSPSPLSTPNEDEIMASSPPRPHFLEAPKPVERRMSVKLRPSLSRAKGYSTNSLPGQIPESRELPPFKFGAGSKPSTLSTSTSMSLGECFMESPQQERRPKSANSPMASMMGPPRMKQAFGSLNGNAMRNGSPIGAHSRRPSNPFIRPRKQFRRSLSMFESPGDIMKAKDNAATLQAIMDVDEAPHQPLLPHFFAEGNPDSIPRIAKGTLLEILDGKYNEHYDQRMVVDCRFEYEYEGGHIDGAVNYNDKEHLTSQLFETALPGKTLLIFHCEYSAHRAPIMARYVRQQDRSANAEHYPRLTYPEVYILDGGYSSFFKEHQARCFPQNYVEMDDKAHAYTCEREMGKLRQTRAKLSRAQTFAFGQSQGVDSPIAINKSKAQDTTMLCTGSPILGRTPTRRMASY